LTRQLVELHGRHVSADAVVKQMAYSAAVVNVIGVCRSQGTTLAAWLSG